MGERKIRRRFVMRNIERQIWQNSVKIFIIEFEKKK